MKFFYRMTWQRFVILLGLGIILLGAGWWFWSFFEQPRDRFVTTRIHRGDLLATVSSTGTIEPEDVVDVGAQVVGMIQEFGKDPNDSSRPIDYRSEVEEGTVLARIDDTIYKARVDKTAAEVAQAKAQVAQAKADLQRADADLLQLQAKYQQASRDWGRAQRLMAEKAIAEEEFDARHAANDVAKANVGVGEAAISQAKAALIRAEKTLLASEADLRESQKNLDYTVIRSPVKGVIVDRRVNVGQTMISSLNAPSLFLIAKDLKRLQIWASVNEADIGRIRVGQQVSFTVDAFPNEVFRGIVTQIRLNATMTQNVVTYPVVITLDNSTGKLLPYLTANVKFEIAQRKNVLIVPNAALRWRPLPEQIAPGIEMPAERKGETNRGIIWVGERGRVRPVEVQIGLSDGLFTEITTDDLTEGHVVVVGERLQTDTDTSNPFVPNILGGAKH